MRERDETRCRYAVRMLLLFTDIHAALIEWNYRSSVEAAAAHDVASQRVCVERRDINELTEVCNWWCMERCVWDLCMRGMIEKAHVMSVGIDDEFD